MPLLKGAYLNPKLIQNQIKFKIQFLGHTSCISSPQETRETTYWTAHIQTISIIADYPTGQHCSKEKRSREALNPKLASERGKCPLRILGRIPKIQESCRKEDASLPQCIFEFPQFVTTSDPLRFPLSFFLFSPFNILNYKKEWADRINRVRNCTVT